MGKSLIIEQGVNDLETYYPDVKKFWDYNKNKELPNEVYYKEQKQKYYFLCSSNHSFSKTPKNFLLGLSSNYNGCPICLGRIFIKGINDLVSKFPNILNIWDYDKNILKPEDVFYNSRENFWMKCEKGHSFKTSPYLLQKHYKSKFKGCPYCMNKRVLSGDNDLKSNHPEIMDMWDYNKNSILPENIPENGGYAEYWFICSKGHSFKSRPRDLIESQKYSTRGCPVCSGHKVLPGVNDICTLFPEKIKFWDWELNPNLNPHELSQYSTKKMLTQCCESGCLNTFETEVQYWLKDTCLYCEEHKKIRFSEGHSKTSSYIASYIRELGFTVIEEFPFSFYKGDIFIPDKNIIFEYNGLYWHTEKYVSKNKHKEKQEAARKLGYDLYYIWEDSWVFHPEIVKSFIKSKLGVSNSIKINARDCTIKHIDYDSAKGFLNKYHIQGSVYGEEYISLYYKDSMVALIVIEGNSSEIQIKRYATSCNVRGGFTKLLHYVKENYVCNSIYTFSDNSISKGDLYYNNGFVLKSNISPDYSYLYENKRVHKFNFRKERFMKDESLQYKEGLSESQLAELNGIYRIYDSGKKKWVLEVK